MHECMPYFKLPQLGCIPSSADGSTSAASAVPPAARMGGMGARRKSANSLSRILAFSRDLFPPFPHFHLADEAKEEWWRRQPTSCGWA